MSRVLYNLAKCLGWTRNCGPYYNIRARLEANCHVVAELRRPEGPPSGAPHSYRKLKETHELSFPWLSWLAVLLVGAYARRRRRRRRRWFAQDGGHPPNNWWFSRHTSKLNYHASEK